MTPPQPAAEQEALHAPRDLSSLHTLAKQFGATILDGFEDHPPVIKFYDSQLWHFARALDADNKRLREGLSVVRDALLEAKNYFAIRNLGERADDVQAKLIDALARLAAALPDTQGEKK